MRRFRQFGMVAMLIGGLLLGTAEAGKRELGDREVLLEQLADNARWNDGARLNADRLLRHVVADQAELALLELDAIADPMLHDLTAALLLQALAEQTASSGGRAFLDGMQGRSPRVWQRHEETRADWFVPVFELQAQASAIPGLWQARAWRDQWRQRLVETADQAFEQLIKLERGASHASATELHAAAQSIAELTQPEFEGLYRRLELSKKTLPPEIELSVAERQPNQRSLRRVIQANQADQMLRVIEILRQWPSPVAEQLLLDLESEPAWSSAATLALIPKLADSEHGKTAIAERLADPQRRASAASAIARMPEQQALVLLETVQTRSKSDHSLPGVLLALELQGGQAAQQRAQQLRQQESAQ